MEATVMYQTIEEAEQALQEAAEDVAADQGEEMVEQGWSEIVHAVADLCGKDARVELLRRNGFDW
jgi:hypothetical protein